MPDSSCWGHHPEVVFPNKKGKAAAVVPVHQECGLIIHTYHGAFHARFQVFFLIAKGDNFHPGAGGILISHTFYKVLVVQQIYHSHLASN